MGRACMFETFGASVAISIHFDGQNKHSDICCIFLLFFPKKFFFISLATSTWRLLVLSFLSLFVQCNSAAIHDEYYSVDGIFMLRTCLYDSFWDFTRDACFRVNQIFFPQSVQLKRMAKWGTFHAEDPFYRYSFFFSLPVWLMCMLNDLTDCAYANMHADFAFKNAEKSADDDYDDDENRNHHKQVYGFWIYV